MESVAAALVMVTSPWAVKFLLSSTPSVVPGPGLPTLLLAMVMLMVLLATLTLPASAGPVEVGIFVVSATRP